VLIGPDNGLLIPAAEALGGITEVRELTASAYRLPVVSSTFHGRDIFAPAAGHLAAGVAFEKLGPLVEPVTLAPSPLPAPVIEDGLLRTETLYVDTFGNVKLSALAVELRAALGPPSGRLFLFVLGDGREVILPWAEAFGERPVGEALLYEDSYGRVCVGVNQGDAATRLGLASGQSVTIARA
jgi:hypothetical protein